MHARSISAMGKGWRRDAVTARNFGSRRARQFVRFLACLVILCMSLAVNPTKPQAMGPDFSGLRLVMIEEEGCGFCQRWKREVGIGYPLSDEGRRAPLVMIDRASSEARALARIVYTPTFVLMRDGVEKGRIVGYPGADFFWTMLAEMMRKQPPDHAAGTVRHAAPQ